MYICIGDTKKLYAAESNHKTLFKHMQKFFRINHIQPTSIIFMEGVEEKTWKYSQPQLKRILNKNGKANVINTQDHKIYKRSVCVEYVEDKK